MKRNLYDNIHLQPYTSGAVVDRAGFLSGIIAASVSAAGTLTFAVTECDTSDGTFTAVADDRAVMGQSTGAITVAADELVTYKLDLVGCKRYVKVTITAGSSAAATYALALGDPVKAPVEG